MVVFAGMVFGRVVGLVCLAGFMVHHVDTFSYVVADAKEFHIHEFGSFLLNTVVGNSIGCRVVGDNGCCFLGVPKFSKGMTFWNSLLTVDE